MVYILASIEKCCYNLDIALKAVTKKGYEQNAQAVSFMAVRPLKKQV